MGSIKEYVIALLIGAFVMLPPFWVGRATVKDDVKRGKLIIINQSSYKCKMINTLKEK